MKKKTINLKKLTFDRETLIILSQNEAQRVLAGDGEMDALGPRKTFACPPPFNAPPYFYPDTGVYECIG